MLLILRTPKQGPEFVATAIGTINTSRGHLVLLGALELTDRPA